MPTKIVYEKEAICDQFKTHAIFRRNVKFLKLDKRVRENKNFYVFVVRIIQDKLTIYFFPDIIKTIIQKIFIF